MGWDVSDRSGMIRTIHWVRYSRCVMSPTPPKTPSHRVQSRTSPGGPQKVNRATARVSEASRRLRRLPRQNRSRDTLRTILEAAGQLLVEQGYAATSTNAIARRAGVSIGSLYQYFPNKQAVYHALVQDHHEQILPLVHAALEQVADPSTDPVGVIGMLMRELVRVHGRNPPLMRAIDTELGWIEQSRELKPSDHDEFAAITVAALRSRRDLDIPDLDVAARLLTMTISHVSRWLVHSAPAHIDRGAVIEASERMLGGLLFGTGPELRRPEAARRPPRR